MTLLGAALLLSTFWILGGRRIKSYVNAYACQSAIVGLIALVVGATTHDPNLYVVAALTLIVKVVAITQILRAVERRLQAKSEIEPRWGKPVSIVLGGLLLVFSFAVSPEIVGPGAATSQLPLAIPLAVLLMGLYVVSTRRHVVTQIIGLLALENGLFTGAVALAHGMPLIIEFAILFDVLVAVIVLALLASMIQRELVSADSGELRKLRG